jgi:putative endonuclease
MARKDVLGKRGEQLAADYLAGEGFEIVARNWRCHEGEVDLVALDGRTTVIVEVKTRSGVGFGHPFEAVTREKLGRLRRLAAAWCRESDRTVHGLRIDVVAVIVGRDGTHTIEHVAGAFR